MSFEKSVEFIKACGVKGISSLRFKVVGLLMCGFTDEFALKDSNNTLFATK